MVVNSIEPWLWRRRRKRITCRIVHIELYIEVVEEEKELNVLFCRRGKKNYMHIDFSGKIAVEVTLKKYL